MYVQYVHLPSYSWKPLVLGTLASVVLYAAWKILLKPLLSPLRALPGPKNPGLIFGNFMDIFRAEPGELHEKWVEEYGPTLVYKMLFNSDRILSLDPKGISYVLNNSQVWQKPPELSTNLARLLGEGLLFAEGDAHKRQRRILNPSFSIPHLRDITPIFLEKSAQLRDAWLAKAAQSGGSYQTDVLAWLSKVTLDIIGLAGFDYEFNSLNPDGHENELNNAFSAVIQQNQQFSIIAILQAFVPIFRLIPTARMRSGAKARKVMDRIGQELVVNKKRSILAAASVNDTNDGVVETKIEKGSITSRDLLSRLVAANMATDLRESQKLADEEVFAQIPTFLFAGHETTATSTTWCLYALARDPEVQTKLRDELLSVATPVPSMEELNALPYLDAVVRETHRVYPAVTGTVRTATKDDVIPLGTPFKDKHGVMRDEIRVKKGGWSPLFLDHTYSGWFPLISKTTSETILIPSLVMNTYKGFWGDDAKEFRPERWLGSLPGKASDMPGVWSHLMTFIGGPRSCIGYRFALVEMKCLLWTLVRTFNIEFVDPSHRDGISKKTSIVTRPLVKSEPDKGTQLPLKLTPWKAM